MWLRHNSLPIQRMLVDKSLLFTELHQLVNHCVLLKAPLTKSYIFVNEKGTWKCFWLISLPGEEALSLCRTTGG